MFNHGLELNPALNNERHKFSIFTSKLYANVLRTGNTNSCTAGLNQSIASSKAVFSY